MCVCRRVGFTIPFVTSFFCCLSLPTASSLFFPPSRHVHWVPISILVILERSPFSIYLFCSFVSLFVVFEKRSGRKWKKRRSGWKSTLTTSSFLYIHQLNRRELIPCNIKMKEEPPPSGVNSKTSKSSVVSGTCTLVNSFSSINCQVRIMTIKSYT